MSVIVPVLCACTLCKRQQSVRCDEAIAEARCGGCGGELAPFDWEAHRATLPVSENDPTDIAKLAQQTERQRKDKP